MTNTNRASRRTRPIDTSGRLMTTAEAAARLGLNQRTLENWRYLPATGPRWIKVGGRVRYPEAEVQAYLDERAALAATDWAA